MKTLVIYDTNYGNTKIIAKAIASKLGKNTKTISLTNFKTKNLKGIDMLVVGCPVIAWNPTEKMNLFLTGLKDTSLQVSKPPLLIPE